MELVWTACPFCNKVTEVFREQENSGYSFQCSDCSKIWSEPTHTINLNKYGENGYIKPRSIE